MSKVEYEFFQCKHCKRKIETMKGLAKQVVCLKCQTDSEKRSK